MPPCDKLVGDLIEVLHIEAKAMLDLQNVMAENRAAFVAIQASPLTSGLEALESSWEAVASLESKREALVAELASLLGLTGQVRISSILPELPPHTVAELRAAANAADEASRRVRAETTAGARLLRLSRQAHEGVIRALTGVDAQKHNGYDKNAQSIESEGRSGRLVIGTA